MAVPPRPSSRNASASGTNRSVRPSGIRAAVPPASRPVTVAPAPAARASGLRAGVKPPGVRASGIRPAAVSVPGDVSEAPEPAEAPPTRTAIRRKPPGVRRSSGSGDGGLMKIGGGVLVVIILIGLKFAFRSATASPNQKYFNSAADFTEKLERGSVSSREAIKSQINALPISSVTDPKLKELHQLMLTLASFPENTADDDPKVIATIMRFDRLVDELNAKYGRK